MKKIFFTMLMLCFLCVNVGAENYPYRSDYLWVTEPNHADWLYKTGEEATVEVRLYKYGVPQSCLVSYEIGDDMLPADKKGALELKKGRATLNIGTRRAPGFRDLRLKATIGGKTYVHHVKVGFSPEKIQPFTKEPKDFKTFWDKNVADMRQLPISYTKEIAKEYCTDKVDCYLLKIKVNNEGQSVYAYLFYPKNARKGSHPAVLCPPGAGIKTIRYPMRHTYYAENGCIRMEMEIHGLDPRLPESTFNDLSKAFNERNTQYVTNRLDSRESYYMKHVYLAVVRCLDLLTELPEWDGRNLVIQGGSQGGALSIVGAALHGGVTQCIVNHPALSDMAAYSAGRTGGWPHFNRMEGMLTPEKIRTMAYYDVVNFARYVKAATYMTWGYNDDVCPPTTSYAVWNTLSCPKESLITPVNEHWTSDTTEYGQMEWMLKKLKK